MGEPVLRPADLSAWSGWMRAAVLNRRTQSYRRAVDEARRTAGRALALSSKRKLSLSGGKDSTALAHLVSELASGDIDVISEKDDLDYPGEEEYVRALAARCGFRLTIVRPEVSPAEWLEQRAAAMSGDDDMHSRAAGLSRACFYGVMEEAELGADVTFWGLRAEESGQRRRLIRARGTLYTLKSGMVRCHPLGHWRGLDVYSYLDEVGIDPLHVYRCCGFLPEHRQDPSRIRKSWWIPGAHAAKGQAAWLRRYYPSLWEKFTAWFPDARCFA